MLADSHLHIISAFSDILSSVAARAALVTWEQLQTLGNNIQRLYCLNHSPTLDYFSL